MWYQFMKERSHFNARLVMLPFHEITAWKCTKLQFMKERSHFYAQFVIFLLLKRANWKDTWIRFIKEISLFNSQVCGARISININLKVHWASLHEQKFECTIWDPSYKEKTKLKNYILSVHEVNKPFQCTDCGTTFARNAT